MRLKVGLDTSFVVGLIDEKDFWHTQALALEAAIEANDAQCYIFDSVLAEVISTLARRIHEKRRMADLPALLTKIRVQFPARSITWLYPDVPLLYDQVVGLVEQSGGELNFNDALIALSCRNRRIPCVASFDADFDSVGWIRRLAQEIDFPVS